MRDVLLALGLLLSPASQLRPAGSPVGPGEICFAAWLGLSVIRNFGRTDLPLSPAALKILAFWLLFAIALSIGTVTAFMTGMHNEASMLKHDIQAYILVAGISLLCVLEPGAALRLRRVAWLFASLGSTILLLQLTQAWGLLNYPQVEPYYWDRFRGWSENPNQLALVCIVVTLVSLHLAETAVTSRERAMAFACTILPVSVGLLTKSDTFMLILVTACPILLVLKIRKWAQSDKLHLGFRPAVAWICVMAVPAILVVAAPVAYVAAGYTQNLEREITENNRDALERDAPERLRLWKEAIDIGIATSMLGLGPGPHLVRREVASVDPNDIRPYVRHPSEDPAADFESHNTILDLFTQGGLIAVLSFGWLSAVTMFSTLRTKLDSLTVLLCALAIFGIFHHIVRHPLLWFVIAFSLVASASMNRPAPVENRS